MPRLRVFLPIALTIFVLVFTSSVFAQGLRPNATRSAASLQRSCEARQASIKNRSDHILKMSTNMLDKFSQISSRTQEFYTNKVLPSGGVVSNYDILVADIASKSGAVTLSLNEASASAQSFDCSLPNPRTQLRLFNQEMRGVIKDLKLFRTSIRNLIVAVHSVTGDEHSATRSGRLNRGGVNE